MQRPPRNRDFLCIKPMGKVRRHGLDPGPQRSGGAVSRHLASALGALRGGDVVSRRLASAITEQRGADVVSRHGLGPSGTMKREIMSRQITLGCLARSSDGKRDDLTLGTQEEMVRRRLAWPYKCAEMPRMRLT